MREEYLFGQRVHHVHHVGTARDGTDREAATDGESALGRVTLGEGVIGLGGAFLSAGVKTVVASLWPIDDDGTTKLMRTFYDELASGSTIAEALRNAQLAMAAQSATHQPFYWAGFVVIGDGTGTVALERRASVAGDRTIVILGVVGLLSAIAFIVLIKKNREVSSPV